MQIHIKGKVYKVGFRYYLKQMASVNHISGYVKYDTDHSLLVEVEGSEDDVHNFVKYCRLGCMNSDVTEISMKDLPLRDYKTFEILE